MTRIQRIEAKANAQRFRLIAGFLAERAMQRAAEGATGLAAECAHHARKLNARARTLERKAKAPYVWSAVVMPQFVLRDMYDYSVGWLLDTPTALLVIGAVLVLVVGMRSIGRFQLAQERRRALKAHRLQLENVRANWPAWARQAKVVAKRGGQDAA